MQRSPGYDKAREAIARGEELRIQRWKKAIPNPPGPSVEVEVCGVQFTARMAVSGEKAPEALREVTDAEADELVTLPNVIDDRGRSDAHAESDA